MNCDRWWLPCQAVLVYFPFGFNLGCGLVDIKGGLGPVMKKAMNLNSFCGFGLDK